VANTQILVDLSWKYRQGQAVQKRNQPSSFCCGQTVQPSL